MRTTRASLIERVRNTDDSVAWTEFYELYSSVVYHYAREKGLHDADASDIVAGCMAALSKRMADFRYEPDRCKFRSYLRAIAQKEIAQFHRKKKAVATQPESLEELIPATPPADDVWERQWEISLLMFCWSRLEREIAPLHAEIFRLAVIQEIATEDISRLLQVSPSNVYQIKARLKKRLAELVSEMTVGLEPEPRHGR